MYKIWISNIFIRVEYVNGYCIFTSYYNKNKRNDEKPLIFHTLPWFDAERLAVNCRLLIISGPSCRKQHSPEPHSASVMQVVASCRIKQNSTQYKNVKKSIFFSQWVCTLVLQFKLINLEYEWIYILKNDYRCSYDSQKRQHNNQKFHCIVLCQV